jgi:hypothetical protein
MMGIRKVSKLAVGALFVGGTVLFSGAAHAGSKANCLSWFELISESSKVTYQDIKCSTDKAIVKKVSCKATEGSCDVEELLAAKPFPELKVEIAKNVKETNPDGSSYAKAIYYVRGKNFANVNIDNLELNIRGQIKLLFPVLTAGMMESSEIPEGINATKIIVGSANGVLHVLTSEGQTSEVRPVGASYTVFFNEKADKATVFGNINWQDYLTIKIKAHLKNINAVLLGVQNTNISENLRQINISDQLKNQIFQIVPEKLVFTVSLDNELLNAIKHNPNYDKWLKEWEKTAKTNDIVGEFAKGIVQILKGEKDSITIEFTNKTNANLSQMLSMILAAALSQNPELIKAILENQFEIHVYVR